MADALKKKHEFSYPESISEQIDGLYSSALDDYRLAYDLVLKKSPEAQRLLESHSTKLTNIREKIHQVMELVRIESGDAAADRSLIDASQEIPSVVRSVKKEAGDTSCIIETGLTRNLPLVPLHRGQFVTWLRWSLLQLYTHEAVRHVSFRTQRLNGNIVLMISAEKVDKTPGIIWSGIDWECMKWYFELEEAQVTLLEGRALQIRLTPENAAGHADILDSTFEEAKSIVAKIREGIDLPTLSPVASKIIHMAIDDTTSASEIAEVMSIDPALTAKVLRVVNSPLYGFRKEITTLSQAIAILGMKALQTLALSVSLVNVFPNKNTVTFDYTKFWERSLAAAIASKLIAAKLDLEYNEEVFICGLTQNIGSLILAIYYPQQYAELMERHYGKNEDIISLELKTWGINHALVGFEVFTHWKLPDVYAESILYHHEPEKTPQDNEKLKQIASIVNISDNVSQVLYEPEPGNRLHELKSLFEKNLALGGEAVDDIMENVSKETLVVAQDFDLSVGKPWDYPEILRNANKKLYTLNLDYEQMNRELRAAKEKAEKLAEELRVANKKLEAKAATDGLTGLYNHRFFFELLQKEFGESKRYNQPLSCVIFDIDFFKKVNDTYGHSEGDTILKMVATIFRNALRVSDTAARYGGEEFSLILPKTELKEAVLVTERIRKTVESTDFTENIRKKSLTISAGVACLTNGNFPDFNTLIESADKALYSAKQTGRNKVVVFSPK